MRIGGLVIADHEPVAVMAETASSHEGRLDLALSMLTAAVDAGADLVKFQLLRGDDLLTPDHPKYPAFQIIQMPAVAWKAIAAEGRRLGAHLVAEVFDESSVALALELDFVAIKIHSTDLANPRMLDRVGASGRPLFLSTGGATFAEVEWALARVRAAGARDIVLLHGFQSFPTRLEDSNLRQIPALRERFGLPVGYADHVDANTDMAMQLPLIAVGAGAQIIEKHLTLDRALKGRDHYSALNPEELRRLVALVRDASHARGRDDDSLSPAELAYRSLMKKTTVARRPLSAGQVLTDADLAFKRAPTAGLAPSDAGSWVGRRLSRAVAQDAVLVEEDFA